MTRAGLWRRPRRAHSALFAGNAGAAFPGKDGRIFFESRAGISANPVVASMGHRRHRSHAALRRPGPVGLRQQPARRLHPRRRRLGRHPRRRIPASGHRHGCRRALAGLLAQRPEHRVRHRDEESNRSDASEGTSCGSKPMAPTAGSSRRGTLRREAVVLARREQDRLRATGSNDATPQVWKMASDGSDLTKLTEDQVRKPVAQLVAGRRADRIRALRRRAGPDLDDRIGRRGH